MNSVQLGQTATQVWGGNENTISPQINLFQRNLESSLYTGLNFSSCSPIFFMLPQNLLTVDKGFGFRGPKRAKVPSGDVIKFDRIKIEGRTLQFKEPVIANIKLENNYYSCQNTDFDILTMSSKLEECIKNFEEELRFIWKEYGQEADNKLTDDAKELKKRIQSHVKT